MAVLRRASPIRFGLVCAGTNRAGFVLQESRQLAAAQAEQEGSEDNSTSLPGHVAGFGQTLAELFCKGSRAWGDLTRGLPGAEMMMTKLVWVFFGGLGLLYVGVAIYELIKK